MLVHPALASRVASIAVLTAPAAPVDVLPTSSAVLGFQLHGRVRADDGLLSPIGVTGIPAHARRFTYVGPEITSVLVRFTPQGAACLGVPASSLAARSVALADILPPHRMRALEGAVLGAPSLAHSVRAVQRFLLALPFEDDPLVTRAVELLSRDDARVAGVARALGTTERSLERRFLARVGVTPKRFARLRRFERAMALVRESTRARTSLTRAALDAGYADQAHFIRDVRAFTGRTPGALLR